MTVEDLKEKRPDLYQAVIDEGKKAGYDEGFEAGVDAGLEQGRKEGADVERARVQAVKEQMIPGHEALIESLMFDGETTGEQAAVKVLAAEKTIRKDRHDAFKEDGRDVQVAHAATEEVADVVTPAAKRERLVNDYMTEHNAGYRDAVLAVSKEHPELFRERR